MAREVKPWALAAASQAASEGSHGRAAGQVFWGAGMADQGSTPGGGKAGRARGEPQRPHGDESPRQAGGRSKGVEPRLWHRVHSSPTSPPQVWTGRLHGVTVLRIGNNIGDRRTPRHYFKTKLRRTTRQWQGRRRQNLDWDLGEATTCGTRVTRILRVVRPSNLRKPLIVEYSRQNAGAKMAFSPGTTRDKPT